MSPAKLSKAEAGRIGARTRWGPPRVIRLSTLSDDQRRAILSYLAIAKYEKTASDVETLAVSAEGHPNDRPAG